MGVTAFSFILLPLCLVWCLNPKRLLQLVFLAGVFEAAAAVTIGSLGVQPGLVPALAFIAYVVLQILLGAHYPGQRAAIGLCMPLLLVGAWALGSSYLMPHLFEGQVYVWPQKSTPPFVLSPLQPSSSNLNQDFYLLLNMLLLILAAMFLTNSDRLRVAAFRAYLASGFLAAAVAVWQFGARVAHVPYPDQLFYSNPGWSILTEQAMGGIPRINGSFAEPASLGSYMASCTCCAGWLTLRGHKDVLIRPLFVVGILGVMLSTSTTGIASLALAVAGVALGGVLGGSTRFLVTILRVGLPLLAVLAVAGAVAIVLAPGLFDALGQIFSATLNKQSSSSYDARTSTDLDSIQAALDTYGLGVGWGSDRSSSLVPGLLAGVGLPGIVGLVWFGVALGVRVARAKRAGCGPDQRLVMDGAAASLVGFLIPACLSAPTISSVTFFLLLALLVAACASSEEAARRLRANRRRHGDDGTCPWPDAASLS